MKIAIAKPTKVPDSSPTESASFQVKTYNPIIPRGKQISELDDHQKDVCYLIHSQQKLVKRQMTWRSTSCIMLGQFVHKLFHYRI